MANISREEVITALNGYVQNNNYNDAMIVLNALCELKSFARTRELMEQMHPVYMIAIWPTLVETITRELDINTITKNNITISFY